MWLGPFLGLDFQRTCHAMYTLTFAVFQVRWEHIEEYLHAFLIVYWWPEICFLQVQQVSRNRSEEISDYESEKILNEALEHGHGSGRPGYGNPPLIKKGNRILRWSIPSFNTPSPLSAVVCAQGWGIWAGIFQHGGVLRRRLHLCEQMAQKKRSTMSKLSRWIESHGRWFCLLQ